MKIFRDEKPDPSGKSYVTILYLCDNPGDDDLQDIAEDVKSIHPGCDLEMYYCSSSKRWGWKVRVLNGKDHRFGRDQTNPGST
jgi:hypothetical protein